MKYLILLVLIPVLAKSQVSKTTLLYSNLNPVFGDTVYRTAKKSNDSIYISSFYGKTWNQTLHQVSDTFIVKKETWFKVTNGKSVKYFSRKNFKYPLTSVYSFPRNSKTGENYTKYIPQKIIWVNNFEIWHYKVVKISGGLNTDTPSDLFFSPKIGIIKEEILLSMNLVLKDFVPYNNELK